MPGPGNRYRLLVPAFISLVFLVQIFLVSSAAGQPGGRNSQPVCSGEQGENIVSWIHQTLKDNRDNGNTTAPDLSGDLKSLEEFVTAYLQHCDSSVPTRNTLWELAKEHQNLISAQEQAYLDHQKELSELTHTYDKIYAKLNKKFKKGVTVRLIKLVIDAFTLPTDPITLLVSTGLGHLEKLYNPKFIPVGVKLDSREVQEGKAYLEELKREHDKLTKILEAEVADEKEFFQRLAEGKDQAIKCRKISRQLYLQFRSIEPQAVEKRRAILEYLTAAAEAVDNILARKAELNSLQVYPSRIEFANIGSTATVKITRWFDTGLELPAEFQNLEFDQDIPLLVTFAPSAGGEISLTAIAAGRGEVRANLAGGEKKVTGRFDVVVSPGSTPSPSPAATATPTPPPATPVATTTATPTPMATAAPVPIPTATPGKAAVQSSAPPRNYFKFTLSESAITMGFNERRHVKATAWYTEAPYFIPQDVTADSNTQWETSWSVVATADRGVIESKSRPDWCTITARFKTPDGKSFDASCKVTVTDRAEEGPAVDFRIEPAQRAYRVGQPLEFIEMVPPPHTNLEFTWYIGSREATGKTVRHIFDRPGKYTARLVIRSTLTGQENFIAKTVHVIQPVEMTPTPATRAMPTVTPSKLSVVVEGTTAPVPDARWRNRFEAEKTGKGLEIRSSYFDPARGQWSQPLTFTTCLMPDSYIIATGEQADGINSGWLVYSYGNGKIHSLKYAVLSYNFSDKKGYVVYGGNLDPHNKAPDPQTLKFKEVKPRGATVEWSCTDGSLCRAEISKYRSSGTSMVTAGVTDLGCIEGKSGRTLKQALQSAAEQQNISPGEVQTPAWTPETDEERNFGTPDCWFTIKGNLPNANEGSVEVYVMSNPPAAENGILKWKKYFLNLGEKYQTNVTPTSFHGLMAFTWTLAYSAQAEKEAKELSTSSKRFHDIFKDWIGYTHYGMAWIQDNAWVSLYTKQNTPAGRQAAASLAEAIYTEMTAIYNGRFYCEDGQIEMITYHSTEWPVRLNEGKLEVGGAKGSTTSWKEGQWKLVDTGVSDFSGRGTSQGPVIVYQQGNTWHIVMLDWAGGAAKNPRNFPERVTIKEAGEFGVILQVGDRCYDYSWQALREVWCETGLYK